MCSVSIIRGVVMSTGKFLVHGMVLTPVCSSEELRLQGFLGGSSGSHIEDK